MAPPDPDWIRRLPREPVDASAVPRIPPGQPTWVPTHRWVCSCFEMVASVRRQPDDRWEQGYAERRYYASPWVSLANPSGSPVNLGMTIVSSNGVANPEMSLLAQLPPGRGDTFRIGDNPRIDFHPLPRGQKEGESYHAWQGFIELWATADLFPQGWVELQEKDTLAPYDERWSRPMGFAPADPLAVPAPVVTGTASEQFAAWREQQEEAAQRRAQEIGAAVDEFSEAVRAALSTSVF